MTQKPALIRFDPGNEIVADGFVHLEAMSDRHFWLGVGDTHFAITSRRCIKLVRTDGPNELVGPVSPLGRKTRGQLVAELAKERERITALVAEVEATRRAFETQGDSIRIADCRGSGVWGGDKIDAMVAARAETDRVNALNAMVLGGAQT